MEIQKGLPKLLFLTLLVALVCFAALCGFAQNALAADRENNSNSQVEAQADDIAVSVDLASGVTSGPYTLATSQEAVFSFESAGPARMAFAFAQSNSLASGNSIHATVEDKDGNKLYEWSISRDTTNVIFGDFVIGSGNYTIRMKANCDIANLSIKMSLESTNNKYGYEIEPNSSIEKATQLELGKSFFGSVYDPANEVFVAGQLNGLSDVDYYRFTLEENSSVNLLITNEAAVHYELGVVSATSTKQGDLKSGKNTISGDLPAGEYFLVIQGGNAGWGKTYTVNLDATPIKNKLSSIRVPYMSFDERTYNGQEKKPAPVVKFGTTTLEAGKDYTVRYEDNINAGTAKVIVDGIGGYTGQLVGTFDIRPKSIAYDMISISDQYYTGKPVTPSPVIRSSNTTLKEGRDYEIVSYANNTETGSLPHVTVQGIGNYEGTATQYFRIKKHNMSEAKISIPDQTYTGRYLWPNPSVRIGNATLKNDVDYFVVHQNNLSVGTASATIYGRGIYEGFVTVNFKIKGVPSWKKSGNRWWYQNADGSYPKNCSMVINGSTYRFDNAGWMRTGWISEGGNWYYHNGSGAMVKGWVKVGGKWYCMDSSTGIMKSGFYKVNGLTYYSNSSGAMVTGWQNLSNCWYYFAGSGAMKTGWQKVSGRWYYIASDGKMLTGKQTIDKKTYFLTGSGAMKTGWNLEGDDYFYYDGSGAMKTNAWISGKYWVGSDGKMARSMWVDNGQYYVDGKGAWVKNKQR